MNNRYRHAKKWLPIGILLCIVSPLFADFNPTDPPEPYVGRVVTVAVEPEGVANVSGAGTFQVGSSTSIKTWNPKSSYHFQYWTLNGKEFNYTTSFNYVVGDSVANLVAHYLYISPDTVPFRPIDPPEPYVSLFVKVQADPSDGGYVSGGGAFTSGQSTRVRVVPTSDYALDHWTVNGYPYSETGEQFSYRVGDSIVTFVAHLVRRQSVTVATYPRAAGVSSMCYDDIQGATSGKLIPNMAVSLITAGNPDYVFEEWQLNGKSYDTQTSSSYIVGDSTAMFVAQYAYVGQGDTTLFNPDSPPEPSLAQTVTIKVKSADETKGTATGSGIFQFAQLDTMIATPEPGYVFIRWENGDTSAVRIMAADHDTTCIAYFGNDTVNLRPVVCYRNSFSVADTTFTESGHYEFYAMGYHNLMALYRIDLTVLDSLVSEQTVEICQGDTFFIGDKPCTTSGDYVEHITSVNDCDSTVVLHLTVHPTYDTLIVASMCQGDTYSLYHFNESETGIYVQSLTTIHGCDSIIRLDLTVYPTYEITFMDSTCERLDYTRHGFVLGDEVTGIVGDHELTDSLLSIHGCDSIVHLHLHVDSVTKVHYYDTICQGDSIRWGTGMITTAGDWFYQKEDVTNACGVMYDVLHLFVHPSLQIQFESEGYSICQGETDAVSLPIQVLQGNPQSYDLIFDPAYQATGFTTVRNVPMDAEAETLALHLNDYMLPGTYAMVVVVHDSFCYDLQSDTLSVTLLSQADSTITQRWNDFLSVRKSAYNRLGGLTDYQWYKNGVLLDGETGSQLYLPDTGLDLDATYSVAMTRLQDGMRMMSCEYVPTVQPQTLTFSAYPSWVAVDSDRRVQVQASAPGRVQVFNIQGDLVSQHEHQSGTTQVEMPPITGLYFLRMITADGDMKTVHLMVK